MFHYGGKVIGLADRVYAYPGEQKHIGAEVVVCRTPANIDLVFAARDKVVGCEVKRLEDLISSHRSHRLHRQLATLLDMVDVPCLVIRGLGGDEGCLFDASVQSAHPHPDQFWGDWVNWQTHGIYVLPVPMANYMGRLMVYVKALGTEGRRALAGTDQRKERERAPGWLLRRIPGIGPTRATQLIEAFGSTGAVLAADRGMVAAVCGEAIERQIRRALIE